MCQAALLLLLPIGGTARPARAASRSVPATAPPTRPPTAPPPELRPDSPPPPCYSIPDGGLPVQDGLPKPRGWQTLDDRLRETNASGVGSAWPLRRRRQDGCKLLEAYNFPYHVLGTPSTARVGVVHVVPAARTDLALWVREAPGVTGWGVSLETCDLPGYYLRSDVLSRQLLLLPGPCTMTDRYSATFRVMRPADYPGYAVYESVAARYHFIAHQSAPTPMYRAVLEYGVFRPPALSQSTTLRALGVNGVDHRAHLRSHHVNVWEDALFRTAADDLHLMRQAGRPEAGSGWQRRRRHSSGTQWQQIVELNSGPASVFQLPTLVASVTGSASALPGTNGSRIIIVTVSYPHDSRLARLCRLAEHVSRQDSVLWIVSDDSDVKDGAAVDLIRSAGAPFVYIYGRKTNMRGNLQRRAAFEYVKAHRVDGIVYNADDDNMYSPAIWDVIRRKSPGKWALLPYGIFGPYPDQREGPVRARANGSCDSWQPLHYTDFRAYPVDMGGFAFDAEVLWAKRHPVWTHGGSGGETQFIEQVMPNSSMFINPTKSAKRVRDGPFRIPAAWECLPEPDCVTGYPLAVHNNWLHRLNAHTDTAACRNLFRSGLLKRGVG